VGRQQVAFLPSACGFSFFLCATVPLMYSASPQRLGPPFPAAFNFCGLFEGMRCGDCGARQHAAPRAQFAPHIPPFSGSFRCTAGFSSRFVKRAFFPFFFDVLSPIRFSPFDEDRVLAYLPYAPFKMQRRSEEAFSLCPRRGTFPGSCRLLYLVTVSSPSGRPQRGFPAPSECVIGV